MSGYAEFLARKAATPPTFGQSCTADDVHPQLHEWQRVIVAWAVRTGRAAIWADTGLGKTLMQVEWARLSGDAALIVAPLAVCTQTVREAAKIGVQIDKGILTLEEYHTAMADAMEREAEGYRQELIDAGYLHPNVVLE